LGVLPISDSSNKRPNYPKEDIHYKTRNQWDKRKNNIVDKKSGKYNILTGYHNTLKN
jgi:hypothetical protein